MATKRRGRRDLRGTAWCVRPGGDRPWGPRERARDHAPAWRSAGAAGLASQTLRGLACGLVIAADTALGLGREAGRVAARLRTDGWHAAVLNGPAALHLARVGSPDEDAPAAAAQAASPGQVATLFETCLLAGGIDRPATTSGWMLAVTP